MHEYQSDVYVHCCRHKRIKKNSIETVSLCECMFVCVCVCVRARDRSTGQSINKSKKELITASTEYQQINYVFKKMTASTEYQQIKYV